MLRVPRTVIVMRPDPCSSTEGQSRGRGPDMKGSAYVAITWSSECMAQLDPREACSLDIIGGWPVLLVRGRYYRPMEYLGTGRPPRYSDILRELRALRKRVVVRFEFTPLGRHVLAIQRGHPRRAGEELGATAPRGEGRGDSHQGAVSE